MKVKNPLVVKVSIEQVIFDPGAVDTHIYCINTFATSIEICFTSESFTTIDEETGDASTHGTKAHTCVLKPNDVKLIGQVHGWEWDGHVGMKLKIKNLETDSIQAMSYDFKQSTSDYCIESLKLKGRILKEI